MQREIDAQTTITQTFGREASKAVASYAASQIDDIKKQREAELKKPAPDAEKLKALGDELQKWDEGGTYRVALHMAVGGLSGGAQGAAGVGAAAAVAPLLNDLQDSLAKNLEQAGANGNVAKAAAQLVTGVTAAGIGSVASGGSVAGAMTAFNADTNNRQLHPTEKQRIQELARNKARETCRGDTSCEKSANLFWTDMLERAAEGRTDTQEAIKNQTYYQQVIQAATRPGTEAAMGAAENFFNALGEAQRMLNADAGKIITDSRGNPILGNDGKPQTYFSATQAQRDDPYGNIFPGGSPNTQASVIPGKERRDQERLERLNTLSGQATPDTTIEELLIGTRLPARGAGSLVQVTERNAGAALVGTAKAAEEALLRSGGAFDRTGKPLLDMSQLSTSQKGVMGELFGPNTVKQIVPDGQKIARMQGVGTNGIDDLYKVNRPDVDYVFVEYKFVGADGKTGAQALGKTADGVQGSQGWIQGSGRIEKAVGADQAIDVDKAFRAGRTETWVVTTRPNGATEVQVLDAFGKPKPVDTSKIILPNVNLSGAQP